MERIHWRGIQGQRKRGGSENTLGSGLEGMTVVSMRPNYCDIVYIELQSPSTDKFHGLQVAEYKSLVPNATYDKIGQKRPDEITPFRALQITSHKDIVQYHFKSSNSTVPVAEIDLLGIATSTAVFRSSVLRVIYACCCETGKGHCATRTCYTTANLRFVICSEHTSHFI